MMARGNDPFDQLLAWVAQLEAAGVRFPDSEDRPDLWAGIAFRVGDARYVAAMDEVREVVELPACTRVPGTVPWFLGIANVRGTLVPVTDLHGFVTRGRSPRSEGVRLLLHWTENTVAGFRVDDVLGVKRFAIAARLPDADAGEQAVLQPFLNGCFRSEGEDWPVLSLSRLIASDDYNNIARGIRDRARREEI